MVLFLCIFLSPGSFRNLVLHCFTLITHGLNEIIDRKHKVLCKVIQFPQIVFDCGAICLYITYYSAEIDCLVSLWITKWNLFFTKYFLFFTAQIGKNIHIWYKRKKCTNSLKNVKAAKLAHGNSSHQQFYFYLFFTIC